MFSHAEYETSLAGWEGEGGSSGASSCSTGAQGYASGLPTLPFGYVAQPAWGFKLLAMVFLMGCASLPPTPASRSTPAAAAAAQRVPPEATIEPLGATWRLKPVGTFDAMRSTEEEEARAASPKVLSRLDSGVISAVAFGSYWWADSLHPSVVLVYPATVLLLDFPMRLRLSLRRVVDW